MEGAAVERPPDESWRALTAPAGFLAANGPFYWQRRGKVLRIGFRVAPRHCNPVGHCHGGMLATCADIVMGFGIAVAADLGAFVPTVSLGCDFLAPARLGDWIAGEAEVLRVTGRLGFAACNLTAADGM